MLAVHHHDKRGFFTDQKLFDDDTAAGAAELVAGQHIFNGSKSFGFGLSNDHAFAGGQAIGFDHNRCAHLNDKSFRIGDIGESLVSGCRDLMPCQEVFSKSFGAFQLRRTFGWAKDMQAISPECIYHAARQRCFRSNDSQCYLFSLGKRQQSRDIICRDGDVG